MPTRPTSTAPNLLTGVPGFAGLDSQAIQLIRQMMSGQLAPGTTGAINDAAAGQAVASGMPGSNRIGGSLFGNRVLRDIGRSSEQQQQQGFENLLKTFGTLQPSIDQRNQSNQNAINNNFRERGYQDQLRERQLAERAAMDNKLEYSYGTRGAVGGQPTGSVNYRYRYFR